MDEENVMAKVAVALETCTKVQTVKAYYSYAC